MIRDRLIARVHAVVVGRVGGSPVLTYHLKGGDVVVGGAPEVSPRIAVDWPQLGWEVPPELADLYAVHDGLSVAARADDLWWDRAILPSARLVPLLAHVRFGEEGVLFDPSDLVLWGPDGVGGGWCLWRRKAVPMQAVSWTRRTRVLGAPVDLMSALDEVAKAWA